LDFWDLSFWSEKLKQEKYGIQGEQLRWVGMEEEEEKSGGGGGGGEFCL